MQIKRSILFCLLVIFPSIIIAANDSTNPEIIRNQTFSVCSTLQVQGTPLNPTSQTFTADTSLASCIWRGQNKASWWAAGITNATYQQVCDTNEVAIAVKFGVRGDFLLYGEYDLYVECCKLESKFVMSQNWHGCP